jgi:protein-S-isoprenylcysteine O-methyltransferase Ste14
MDLGTIILLVSTVWLGSEIALARIKRSQPADAQLDKSSMRTLWMTIGVSVTLAVFIGLQRIGHFELGSRHFPIAGITLIICGLCVRWFAILSLKHQFTVDVSIRENHRMIKKGIYRFVRHPAYAGSLLSFFGLGFCFSNYLSILIISVPICVAFLHRVRIEEEALIHAFGSEYLDYRASTKRFIPGIY